MLLWVRVAGRGAHLLLTSAGVVVRPSDVPLSHAMLALVEKQDTTPRDTPADTTQTGDSSSLVAASESAGAGSTNAVQGRNPRRTASKAASKAPASTGSNTGQTGTAGHSVAKTTADHNERFEGGDWRAKPDLAVFMEQLVFALGETKAEHTIPEDRCVLTGCATVVLLLVLGLVVFS